MTRTLTLCLIVATLSAGAADSDWPINGGPGNIRYTELSQITPANVGQLQVAWSWDAHEAFKDSEMQSNPIVVDGVLYATTPKLHVIALDARTGREIWKFDPSNGDTTQRRFRHRGVTVYKDRLFVTYRSLLFCLDRKTGKPLPSFAEEGHVDLRKGLDRPFEALSVSASSPGVIYETDANNALLIMGSTVPETLPGAPGDIRAYDVHTGQMKWTFHTIPHPGEFGYDTWPVDAWKVNGGANSWAGLSIDQKLGMVFAATGSASFDFYGANRVGDNLFADCVLALDARTGKRVWHFQGVKHDLWDLDFPAAPSLVTVTRDGKKVDAVAQIAKTGFVFVFDRKTGEPLFPIEYRKVPASTLDGEKAAATQPFPVMPPPFTRQKFTEDVVTNRTPEAHAAVLEWLRRLDSGGMFTPPSARGTVLMPGTDGGEWGGAAFDPETGLLYVNSNEQPWIIRMVTQDTTSLYNNNCASCHKEDRTGTPPTFPSLVGIGDRRPRAELIKIINEGTGRMPGFSHLGRGTQEIVDFLVTGRDSGTARIDAAGKDPNVQKYRNEGYILMRDPDGYPPLTPPWGTLNAIDLNKGEIRWRIPFGEYPELVAKGIKETGSDNYGGPVVTKSGLLFIGATNFDKKFRAYDKLTGKLLWETVLPAAGNATPSVYEIDGREYVVIVCGGGKNEAPSGSSIVAFALPGK
jgi:quinoprotein glucose dehydrogenase